MGLCEMDANGPTLPQNLLFETSAVRATSQVQKVQYLQ